MMPRQTLPGDAWGIQTYEPGLREPLLPSAVVHLPSSLGVEVRREPQSEFAIDDALDGSFPASDPPAWNPGLARPGPVVALRKRAPDLGSTAARDERSIGTAAGPAAADSQRKFGQGVTSLAAVAGIALLVPFAILAVGVPIALFLRGGLEILGWLVPALR